MNINLIMLYELRKQGKSYDKIGKVFGVKRQAVFAWFKSGKLPKKRISDNPKNDLIILSVL